MKFKGNLKTKKTRYIAADKIKCDINNPESCTIKVSEQKAAQLLTDFPDEWEIMDKISKEEIIERAVNGSGHAVQVSSTNGVKLIFRNGDNTRTVTVPNNSVVEVLDEEVVVEKEPEKPKRRGRKPITKADSSKEIEDQLD